MSNKILIKCDEATTICDKTQYGEASLFDRFRLALHNFLCKRCHLYSEQNKILTKIFKAHTHTHIENHLCDEDKNELKKALEKELKK